MAHGHPPTVLALKQKFLSDQIRLLSAPLEPSRKWQRGNAARERARNHADEGGSDDVRLPDVVVDDALVTLNQALRQHCARVYAAPATRQVAEHLERLYCDASALVGEDEEEGRGRDGDALRRDADLMNDTTITALPETWPSARAATAQPLESKRYADGAARLAALSGQRVALLSRLARLRRMHDLLAPFRPETAQPAAGSASGAISGHDRATVLALPRIDGAGSGELPSPAAQPLAHIQENLVTRDGELERELEKMRVLLVRVGSRVAALPEATDWAALFRDEESVAASAQAGVGADVGVVERRKVEDLLERM